MSKTQANVLMALMVVLIGGLEQDHVPYTILLLKQPTVIANEIRLISLMPLNDINYYNQGDELHRHRSTTENLFFSDGTVMRREKYFKIVTIN